MYAADSLSEKITPCSKLRDLSFETIINSRPTERIRRSNIKSHHLVNQFIRR